MSLFIGTAGVCVAWASVFVSTMTLSSSDVARMIMDDDSDYSDLSDDEVFSELSSDSGKYFFYIFTPIKVMKKTFFINNYTQLY